MISGNLIAAWLVVPNLLVFTEQSLQNDVKNKKHPASVGSVDGNTLITREVREQQPGLLKKWTGRPQ